jgi:hypothetical protein
VYGMNLVRCYYEQKDYNNMRKYYLMTIERNEKSAMNNLAYYYGEQEDYKKYIFWLINILVVMI